MTAWYINVVIVVLVAYMAIIYFPFDKNKKLRYGVAMFIVTCIGTLVLDLSGFKVLENEDINKGRLPFNYREIIQRNPHAEQTLMAAYNVTDLEEVKPIMSGTNIEISVGAVMMSAFIFTPLLLLAAIEDCDEKKTERLHKLTFALCAVATALLLSLCYGLKLTIVPIYKKAFVRGTKSSPALS